MIADKLRLRAVEPSDVDFIYELENLQDLWNVSNTRTPYSRFAIEQYVLNYENDIYNQKQLRLVIEYTNSGNCQRIGVADLFDFDPFHKRACVGIVIVSDYRRKGFASKALDLIIEYSFNYLDLHQLYCNISNENTVSLKLFQGKGFENNGIKKQWLFENGKWIDVVFLQLIRKA